ncbi:MULTISPECIES: transcriptional regulator GcvA [Pseudomonas]|uniref:Transcriptional regulator, LysR family n=1 Tax=Pseudomonas abietaniphila TaxID=89065 RepID=A0A1G7VFY1_9PSED|nr:MULTISPECIES: transcriptional regulator GcvA [Pseudomonas]MBK3468459.1 transcriptional regulator GcvA [Pseudomonas sp. MF6776]SDG58654.1 transcriptional regulator, LysR family [Pseudomonas abietaniphila]
MKKRLPPLNWLRAFEASARLLNFTHAAQELNLTQAAISQQLKALESQLGAALFKRLPRGLELTEAGMSYFPVVRESVERLAAATDEIFGQGHRSALIVRSSLVFFTHWLAMRLPQFRRLYPQINLRIASSIWVEDSESDADLDIRYGQGRWPGLKSERLTWDTLVPVCSAALAAGEPPLNQPQDLIRHELLHVLGYEDGWGYWLKKSGAEDVDSSQGLQFDTLISALEVAELGQGIALARSSLVRHLLDSGRLVAPFGSEVTTKEAFYLVYAAHSMVNPDAAAFAEWLCAEATDFRNATKSGSQEDYEQ